MILLFLVCMCWIMWGDPQSLWCHYPSTCDGIERLVYIGFLFILKIPFDSYNSYYSYHTLLHVSLADPCIIAIIYFYILLNDAYRLTYATLRGANGNLFPEISNGYTIWDNWTVRKNQSRWYLGEILYAKTIRTSYTEWKPLGLGVSGLVWYYFLEQFYHQPELTFNYIALQEISLLIGLSLWRNSRNLSRHRLLQDTCFEKWNYCDSCDMKTWELPCAVWNGCLIAR